jgi:hypothetical protein
MLRIYLRVALFLVGLVAAIVLFAFAFTAAAIVTLIGLAVLLLFGRVRTIEWEAERRARTDADHRPPLIIDHDPNDLPKDKT